MQTAAWITAALRLNKPQQLQSGAAFLAAPTPVRVYDIYPCKYSLQSPDQEVWDGVSHKLSLLQQQVTSCNLQQLPLHPPHQVF